MKIKILLLALALTVPASAGKYAAEFLDTGIGVRALGMGGAFVASADDGSAGFWNPAGMVQARRTEVSFMHAAHFNGLLQSDVLHLIRPSQSLALGATYLRVGIDGIKYTSRLDLNGRPVIDREVTDVEDALLLSAAKSLRPNLSFGATVKALRQRVGDNSALGFGVDLGVHWRPAPQWALGASLQDISGTHVYWDTGHRDIKPPRLNVGASWKKSINLLRSSLALSVQQIVRFEGRSVDGALNFGEFGNTDVSLGGEYTVYDLLSVRLGSHTGALTAGAGISFKQFRLDYAFMSHDLGNAHRVALTVGW